MLRRAVWDRDYWWQQVSSETDLTSRIRREPHRFRRRASRGLPASLRWSIWRAALSPGGSLKTAAPYNELAKLPSGYERQIRLDVSRSFCAEVGFDQEGLFRILNAYAVHNPMLGYCQGMGCVAGLLLLVSKSEEEAFEVFTSLLDTHGLSGLYSDGFPLLQEYREDYEQLLLRRMPGLHKHMDSAGVRPELYLSRWYLSLFIGAVPLREAVHIWDALVVELVLQQPAQALARVAASLLRVLEVRLRTMDLCESMVLFEELKSTGADICCSSKGSICASWPAAQWLLAGLQSGPD